MLDGKTYERCAQTSPEQAVYFFTYGTPEQLLLGTGYWPCIHRVLGRICPGC